RGEALLPVVYDKLKQTQEPRERSMLTLLRYRLVASSTLLLEWPGGLPRLAAAEIPTRQAAAQELTRHARAADARLLIELFSDADPLVREMSLTALREVGGPQASQAITRLLKDPEANVRAAVLKVLAEKPSPEVVGILAEYSLQEKDTDL